MTTAPAVPSRALCAGCGAVLAPAAAAGFDGTAGVFDRHPGCENIRRPALRLLKGGKSQ